MPIRIGVTRNKGAKKPQASTVFLLKLPTTYKTLTQTCKSKLKIKCKTARLFVCRGGGVGVTTGSGSSSGMGFEITPDVDLDDLNNTILCNGMLICVSEKGADYKNGDETSTGSSAAAAAAASGITSRLSKPPRWFPGLESLKKNDTPAIIVDDSDSNCNSNSATSVKGIRTGKKTDKTVDATSSRKMIHTLEGNDLSVPLSSYDLNGAFPIIPKNADMREIMQATISFGNRLGNGTSGSGRSNNNKTKSSGIFQEINRDGNFIVYDYKSEGNIPPEFPDPLSTKNRLSDVERYQRGLLRECRGLILCAQSGRVRARRFHKFFNVDENEECQFEVVRDKVAAEGQGGGRDNDFTPGVCFEKIDGCLCSPVVIPTDEGRVSENDIIWATRRTQSSEIEDYVKSVREEIDYNALCLFAFQNLDATPLFEFCPSSHIIAVVNHAETSLKFLAFRNNITGAYFDMNEATKKLKDNEYILKVMDSIPKAEQVCLARNLQLFCADEYQGKEEIVDVRNWGQGREGVVIAFPDGTRYKLKSDWYVMMARASKLGGKNNFLPHFLKLLREKKDLLTLDQIPEDKLWLVALYDVDDVTAACVSHLHYFRISSSESLEGDACQLFLRFIRAVRKAFKKLLSDLQSWAKESFEITQSIHVVSNFAYQHFGWPSDLIRASLQSCLHEGSASENHDFHSTAFEQYTQLMKNVLLTIAKDPKEGVEKLTSILGVKWYFGKDDVDTNSSFLAQYHIPEDEVLPTSFADFVRCPTGHDVIQNHVLEKYALKKVAMLMGEQEPSFIYVPHTYRPDEGRIKGFWEQFQRYDVLDLRVDLQSRNKNGPTSHEGNRDYALFLVQFGLGPNKKVNSTGQRRGKGLAEYPKGDIAGVLLPTQTKVSLPHFIEALTTSFKMKRMVRMQRRCVLLEGESLEDNASGFYNIEYKKQWVLQSIPSERITPTDKKETLGMNKLKNDTDWTLYCDLDGVLADFEKGVQKVTGAPPHQQQLSKMWRKILGQSKFFAHLEFMPGADVMWAEICKIMQRLYGDEAFKNLKILTGLPMTCKNQVHKDKRNWCTKNLFPITGSPIDVITCQSKNKHEHSAPGCILIDDSLDRKKDWAMYGGVLIHHVSNARTLYEFRRTVGLLQEWIENECSLVIPLDGSKFREVGGAILHDNKISYKWISGDDIPFNASDHQFVGFDCEWDIHTSLVQLAVLSLENKIEVYLIDILNAGPHLLSFVRNEICCNEGIVKIGFALESDATQLQVQIKNAVDLQEVATDLMNSQHWSVKGSNIGFGDMVQEIIGIIIPKDKSLQNCNWSDRPLSAAQMTYAAGDSFYSLKMYIHIVNVIQTLTLVESSGGSIESKIIPPKNVIPRRGFMEGSNRRKKAATADDDWVFPEGTVVNPIFSGAFLSPASKQELIRHFKPQYKNIAADHVTFCANIEKADLAQILPFIGSTCQIGIEKSNSYATSCQKSKTQVDCVRIRSIVLDETKENLMPMVVSEMPHITLSTGINTQASASLNLITDMDEQEAIAITEDNTEDILYLRAVIGLVVTEKNDQLAGIGHKIRNQIDDFMSGKWIMGEQLRFSPGDLSSVERSIVHAFAENNNLESRSEGHKNMRKLTLVKKREAKSIAEDSITNDVRCVDERVFKCGNEAIDEEADSQKRSSDKKTKRITDTFRCTKLHYDFNGEVVNGSILDDSTTTEHNISHQQSDDENQPLGGILIDTNGACKIKWYEDKHSTQDAQESLAEADVIIMRGLPGSGKSTLCKLLTLSNIEIMGNTTICSADLYFENGGGILNNREKKRLVAEGVDIYNHVFSVDKLGDAHQFCWKSYQKAMEDMINGNIGRIILDNTNSQKREYQKYLQVASDNSLKVVIVEVACSGTSQVSTFCRRSSHDVPQRASHAMFTRWEQDERAFILESLTDEQDLMKTQLDSSSKYGSRKGIETLPSGVTFNDKTLSNWMSENHMFHFSKSRSDTTHLQMAVGANPATFISISKKMRNTFLLRYADNKEPSYIHEMIGGDADIRFRMFLDIDLSFVRCITSDELEILLLTAQQCTASRSDMVIATGITDEILWEPKIIKDHDKVHQKRTGLHLRLPQTYVNRDEALMFCKHLVRLLNDRIPLINWTEAVDTETYGPGGGLRMIFSRKVTKGVDVGRVYNIIATLLSKEQKKEEISQDKTGEGKVIWGRIPLELAPTLEKVVELCSIHKYLDMEVN